MNQPIDQLRDLLFDLIGHILYDDIADLDTNWKNMADILQRLKYPKPVQFITPKSPKDVVLAPVLRSLSGAFNLKIEPLAKLVEEMEDLSRAGSNDAIRERDAEKLRNKTDELEAQFLAFIDEGLLTTLDEGA